MDFRAHMVTHLLLGQAVPLLLVAAAPVTLLLRALPVGDARRVTWLLGTWPLRWLTEPVVAGALSVGGLWVLYRTPVYALTHVYGWVHLLVHAHLLISGLPAHHGAGRPRPDAAPAQSTGTGPSCWWRCSPRTRSWPRRCTPHRPRAYRSSRPRPAR